MAEDIPSKAKFHPRECNRRTKMPKQIFGDELDEEEYPVVHRRPTKRKLYPQTPLRGYNAVRAARLVCLI